jgi:hypothetical protein
VLAQERGLIQASPSCVHQQVSHIRPIFGEFYRDPGMEAAVCTGACTSAAAAPTFELVAKASAFSSSGRTLTRVLICS